MPAHKLTDDLTWPEIVEKILKETNSQNNSKFREWLLTKENIGYTLGGSAHWKYLYNVYHKINFTDGDMVEVTGGIEGSGKSTLAIKAACIVDPTFCKERIFNSRLEFISWLKNNNGQTKGKAILIDEGALLIFNRESQTTGSINIIKLFQLCRQANLYILVCIPYVRTIDGYLRQHRIDALTQITEKKKNFCHYNKKGVMIIDECLRKGVPFKDIRVPEQHIYYGHWSKDLPQVNDINDTDYRDIKHQAWTKFLDDTERSLAETEGEELFIPLPKAARMVHFSYNKLKKKLESGEIPHKRIGTRWLVSKAWVYEGSNVKARGRDSIILKHSKKTDDVKTIDSNNQPNETK